MILFYNNIIMKQRILSAALILAVLLLAAPFARTQPPVKWSIATEKTGASSYNLKVSGALPPSWYMYGINSNVDGLTPPVFSFDYEKVHAVSTPVFSSAP